MEEIRILNKQSRAIDSYHREKEDQGYSLYAGGDGITIKHAMANGTLIICDKFIGISQTKGGQKFRDGGI